MNVVGYSTKRQQGLSLIEFLATVAVLAILLGVAMPSYQSFIAQKRVRTGTEELYNFVKMAHSLSLKTHTTIYLSMIPGTTWCYGLSDTVPCNCATVNSCRVSNVETVTNSSSYSGQPITLAITGFSSASGVSFIQFNGARGTVSAAGTASFSLSGLSATLSLNTMGLAAICSNTVSGFPSC